MAVSPLAIVLLLGLAALAVYVGAVKWWKRRRRRKAQPELEEYEDGGGVHSAILTGEFVAQQSSATEPIPGAAADSFKAQQPGSPEDEPKLEDG
jgi:hypothetical protein